MAIDERAFRKAAYQRSCGLKECRRIVETYEAERLESRCQAWPRRLSSLVDAAELAGFARGSPSLSHNTTQELSASIGGLMKSALDAIPPSPPSDEEVANSLTTSLWIGLEMVVSRNKLKSVIRSILPAYRRDLSALPEDGICTQSKMNCPVNHRPDKE